MRYLTTLLLAALSLNAVGQTNQNYNPDYDDDGVIGVSDILGILSTFGDTWDSGDVMVIEITPITNDNIHEAVDLWLSDECSATVTYGPISAWDVSGVTSMYNLFYEASSFNGDLSLWDVSSVTDMKYMFRGANIFNGDISGWDVSSVTDMTEMFDDANIFNGDLSGWDVSSVTKMTEMFNNAYNFNGDISSWDVSSVTSMFRMFYSASNFNQDLSAWDVSSVTNLGHMFYSASNFNGDISSWDVSSVTLLTYMFLAASNFNQDLSAWDVSSVESMNKMFKAASSFNRDISSWDVSSVTDMAGMFDYTTLSEDNQCLIHTSFASNENWPYDWSEFCPAVFNSCGDDIGHEGYDYSTVLIGEQCWFSENCRYLPDVSPYNVVSETDPYYYVYGYEGTDVASAISTSNYATYGVLYNWPAVMTEGICPSGWHIPSDGEWQTMEMSLGMSEAEVANAGWRGTDEGYQMKSTSGWANNGNGSNSSGFNGSPGGCSHSGGFNYDGYIGYWWSTSESGSYSSRRELDMGYDGVYANGSLLEDGLSARCVRD